MAETSKEKARQEIDKLVEKYKALPAASKKKYTEADTKTIFIERLFSALGWDVYGGEEVTQEQRASRGRVDYAFRLRGISKFFLEAKPLKADLDNPEYAKQVINYAWHKDVTWAILTDFESLKVFNAEWKELIVSRSQFFELKCDEYLSRFDWLWLLSHPACEQNLLDQKALELFKKTKKTPVGQQLFSDLVSWRSLLSKYLSKYNKKHPAYLIDEAVQRILDRLIFIRTCEDRGIEPPILRPLLREWQNGARKDLIQELKHIWNDFDQGYDSRLFQPHLADELECEPTPFEQIISELYSTKDGSIQYNFNDIGADVLGGIYEQYLEHLIKKAGKEVEVIPESGKRKAQGIYYTPKFVVRYIVENTLGPALKDKPLNEARKIRILDPACGSGSFLVEALDYLENHWRQQKWVPQSKAGDNAQQADFFDYVTKFQFLTENIYGVDLDTQAVEIAQLNLLLKALSQRQRLPDLVNYIRQGNSLISGSEDVLKRYFGNKWREKKPFNWEQQFTDIMADGGFDVIIGNPPYIQVSMDRRLEPSLKEYFLTAFGSSMGRLNTFGFFIHRGISLLKKGGYLGYIIPNTFLTQEYYRGLRKFVLDTCQVAAIATLEEMPFETAIVENVIIILRKEGSKETRAQNQVLVTELGKDTVHHIPQSAFHKTFNYSFVVHLSPKLKKIAEKIKAQSVKLGDLVSVNQAIALKHDRKSCLFKKPQDNRYKKVLDGRDIARYAVYYPGNYLLYDITKIHSCKREDIFLAKEKILFRRVGDRIVATLDTEQHYALNTLVVITPKVKDVNLRFILGIINSTLANSYYKLFLKSTKRVFSEIQARQVEQIPIRLIDFANPNEKKRHDYLVALVDRMLGLNKRLAPIHNTSCNERDELLREIERTDKEIDNLAYDLYGLTEEEKKIVEGSNK